MKRIVIVLGCVIALYSFSPQSVVSQTGSVGVSFNAFYDGLSPYGEWVSAGSGVYGWRPSRVAAGWRPYTVGRWCWTDDGWYWVSDEPWGWAAYHYGRWTYDDYYGWIWIPGYDWAPAWVEWRYGDDCVGWAPLSPYAVFSVSWGIHYRTRWDTPHSWWSFVDCGNITHPNIHRYVYRDDNNTRFIGRTRGGGSVRYSGGRIVTRGPEREYIERRGNIRIESVRIREVEQRQEDRVVRDGNREQIEVYRPRIQERRGEDGSAERPARVREEGGRSVDLDTRKIDVRAREVEREGEYRTRDESGRGAAERAQREARQRDDASNADRQRNMRGDDQRAVQRQPGTPRPEARPERQARPERREEVRTPERRVETPQRQRDSAPRNSGGGRSEGGRSGRGRG